MAIKHPRKVAIVGGGGRVGLPLGLVLCDAGHTVTLVETNTAVVETIQSGTMPFHERGADELLLRCLASGQLLFPSDEMDLSRQDIVIVTIGTPVDEYLDPDVRAFDRVIESVLRKMCDGQLLVIRSTVFPGVTERLSQQVAQKGLMIEVSYCPERIAQGYAIEELTKLPQFVSGCSERATNRAKEFFEDMGVQIIELSPIEAELSKLFNNSYRYINFAISNQFYMTTQYYGADFHRIHKAITHDYPRMQGFSGAGFTAGPCLLKDTMQLASFNHNLLPLGQFAMMVNEGLPRFLVDQIMKSQNLSNMTVGILGMAFKGNCDDSRSSLSYKLRKVLTLECKTVLCTDPYVIDPELVPLEQVLNESDLLILGACHDLYRDVKFDKPVVDIFGFLPKEKE